MSDKLLLNYKGNLDVSDIPGALAGSKQTQLSKIHGRDYINVYDIAGAVPKMNVGYTGKRRFDDDDGQRGGSIGRGEIQQSPLIGMPKLRQVNPHQGQQNKAYHSRDHSHLVQNYNQFVPPLQEKQQMYQQTPPVISRIQPTYEDALDKFMTQRGKQMIPMFQSSAAQPDYYQSPREQLISEQEPKPLLTSRNNQVAKSTANLIMKSQFDDNQYSSVKHPVKSKLLDLKETVRFGDTMAATSKSGNNSPSNSPNQVQKKIKEIQSQHGLHMSGEQTDNFLTKVSQKNQEQMFKQKKSNLFNINSSTIPENGRYQEKNMEGSIKRSLNLAPSTSLGQHHKEEVDDEIQKREYTKLGGGHLHIQMPSEMNNINYHRSNPMKDYTYNNLTGAYYNKVPK